VDITKAWSPDLTIVDGYDALEGIGPWPGDVVPLRAIISSNDVVLADFVATQLMRKEMIRPVYALPIDFQEKFVKSTWLGFEQHLGNINPGPTGDAIKRTIGPDRIPILLEDWEPFIAANSMDFRNPEYRDEGLILGIGNRFGKQPVFASPAGPYNPAQDFHREYLPLYYPNKVVPDAGRPEPTSNWGPAALISDEWRRPHLGASVMFSGVFGLLKEMLEKYFSRELNMLDGFAVIYGPLRKPVVCEGAILFGDGAVETEYMVFAPRIYQAAGGGKPPNCYSDVFERLSQEMGGKLVGFATETITFSRGWYW
jgi:hypothetical protein